MFYMQYELVAKRNADINVNNRNLKFFTINIFTSLVNTKYTKLNLFFVC